MATNEVTTVRCQTHVPISYSGANWRDEATSSGVARITVNGEVVLDAMGEDVYEWPIAKAGAYVFSHEADGFILKKVVRVIAPEVVIKREGDNLCKLTTADGGSEIRYTTDGSEPTRESALYTGPFQVSLLRLSFIRACTFGDGYPQGRTAVAAFTPIGSLVSSAESVATVDTRAGKGPLTIDGPVDVSWSGLWASDATADVVVEVDGQTLVTARGEGAELFYPLSVGSHVLMHTTYKDTQIVGAPLTATLVMSPVLGRGYVKDGAAVIPNGVTEIAEGAFAGKGDLRAVSIPSCVSNIAANAFAGCVNLTHVTLNGGINAGQRLSAVVVDGTNWTEDGETADGSQVYRSNVIADGQSTEIAFDIPSGMEQFVFSWKVGSESYCDKLAFYLDDDHVSEISGAIEDWLVVTNELDGAVHRARFVYSKDGSSSNPPDCGWVAVKSAAVSCTLAKMFPDSPIESVAFGENISVLPDHFFDGCEKLKTISLTDALKNFGDNDVREIGRRAGIDGLWVKDGWALGYIGEAEGEVAVPRGVRGIASYALEGQVAMTRVTLPASLESIGICAFSGCDALKQIVIPENVDSVGRDVFSDSSALTSVFWAGNAPRSVDEKLYGGSSKSLVSFVRSGSTGWGESGLPQSWPSIGESRSVRVWTTYPDVAWLVRFDLGACGERSGGGELEQMVADGGAAVAPTVRAYSEDGYAFNGWNREFSNVTESILVRAKYLKDGQDVGTGYSITSGGDGSWGVSQYSSPYEYPPRTTKKYSAGNIEIGDEVWLEMKVQGAGLVGFKWWINDSSDSGQYSTSWGTYAPWKVSVDGELKDATIYANGADWGFQSAEIGVYGEGEHIIRWSFVREADMSQFNGFAVGAISWKPASTYVTLRFNPNGGSCSISTKQHMSGEMLGVLPMPMREGYEFIGWFTAAVGGTQVTAATVVTKDVTYYAHWKSVVISAITYANLHGATHANPETYQEGTVVAFTPPSGRTGYTFTGWTPAAITADMTGAQTVTAGWRANSYQIAYYANGGAGTMTATDCEYDKEGEIAANGFTRSGYVFKGWATEENGEVVYQPGDKVTNLTSNAGGVVRLYAVWEVENVQNPVVTPSDGSIFKTESCTVTITCATEGAEIYYTTNGRTPRTTEANRYTGPFTISDTATIVAIAVKGEKTSEYVEATITKVIPEPLTLVGVLDEPKLADVTTGGDAEWLPIDDATAKVGGSCAMSGVLDDNGGEESTWLEAKVYGKGTLTFWWRVSCEPDPRVGKFTYDFASFVADDEVIVQKDGESDWAQVTKTFTTDGEHVIRWSYNTDGYPSDDYDGCVWVDGVAWSGSAAPEELPKPTVEGDEGATVTGDAETGFVIKPSEGTTSVEVTIPQGVDAAKVTVEVS
ncbi:MAG: InlB B-repeat-containing protein, partial [bacterium]|nr:InlB B-repeat-containing protein [Candidatus Colisoma equi]